MGKVNYAAIDIGSNAVRLLIKSIDREAVQEKKIKKVMMLRVPLRLGFDVFSIGELSEKKADKLRRLMKAFRQLMKIYDVDDYRACATSAMRDARNGRTIIKKIQIQSQIILIRLFPTQFSIQYAASPHSSFSIINSAYFHQSMSKISLIKLYSGLTPACSNFSIT